MAHVPVVIYHIPGLSYMKTHGWKRRLIMMAEKVVCTVRHQVFRVSDSITEVAAYDSLVKPSKIKVFLYVSGNGVDSMGRFDLEKYPPAVRLALRER